VAGNAEADKTGQGVEPSHYPRAYSRVAFGDWDTVRDINPAISPQSVGRQRSWIDATYQHNVQRRTTKAGNPSNTKGSGLFLCPRMSAYAWGYLDALGIRDRGRDEVMLRFYGSN
jgi:hypothetical protein